MARAKSNTSAPVPARPHRFGWTALVLWAVVIALLGVTVFLVTKPAGGGVVNVGQAQVQALSKQGVAVVDVRTPAEFAGGHIPGAQNIPIDTFSGVMANWDKSKPLVVYCQSGSRSAQAVSELQQMGWKGTIYHFSQGFGAWTGAVEQGAGAANAAAPPKLAATATPVIYEFYSDG